MSLLNSPAYDFGYTWPWTHGRLVATVRFGLVGFLAWPRWTAAASAGIALWGIAPIGRAPDGPVSCLEVRQGPSV